ncbi:nucleotidyltransferase family protein [Candidatus Margulisiibacteriota bacterium]
MFTTKEVLSILKSRRKYLISEFGFNNIFLFGSYAVGKQKEESDIDLLIEIDKAKKTYGNLLKAKSYLNNNLNKEVEIIFSDSCNPIIGKNIRENLIKIE